MRWLPPLAAVRAFEAAARHGTFTAAAVELGTTQAAVSYQIRILEERLGTPVFLRHGRRVVLTPAGSRAAARLHQAFDDIGSAFAELRGEVDALLRLSATNSFANSWLARHLGRFQAEHPQLEIRLDSADRLVDFAADDVDVAIRSGRGQWPGLTAERLFDLRFAPMCAPALVAGRTLPIDPGEALAMRRVNPRDRWWAVWLQANGVTPELGVGPAGIRMDSQITEGQAALGGQGLAMLTPDLWRRDLADGRLVQPFAGLATEGEAYWLVYAEGRRTVGKIARFRQWMLASFAVLD